jgi:hypothetical protein
MTSETRQIARWTSPECSTGEDKKRMGSKPSKNWLEVRHTRLEPLDLGEKKVERFRSK